MYYFFLLLWATKCASVVTAMIWPDAKFVLANHTVSNGRDLLYGGTRREQPHQLNYIRPCYFTNWAQYRQGRGKYVPEDYVPGLCTHILVAFGWMNENFTVRAYDPADLPNAWAGDGIYARVNKLKLIDRHLKTLLSFGGWTFGTRLFQQMSRTLQGRSTFIQSAIAFVRVHNFDGIDIDWEYPQTVEDKINYSFLVKELKQAVEAESFESKREQLLITAAVSAGENTIKNAYDIPEISQYFDFVLLMSYDFHGAWETETGLNSPLYGRLDEVEWQKNLNIDSAARYWVQHGMPAHKLVIGIPTYGRGWTLKDTRITGLAAPGTASRTTKYVGEAGVIAYYEICEMLAEGAQRYWHAEQQAPYLVYNDQWFSYDDEESILNKIDWLKRGGYGGAFVWTLDFDDFNGQCSNGNGIIYPLISVIARELSGVEIAPKTTTTRLPSTAWPLETTTAMPQKPTTFPVPSGFCKRQQNGFYPHPTSCTAFILCLNGRSYSLNCPPGLEFSRENFYCTEPYNSGCSPEMRTSPTSTTLPTTSTEAFGKSQKKFNCVANGFFPDEENCRRFYRCVDGVGYSFDCPNGLNFNPVTLMCDHPDRAPCAF